MKVEMMPIDWLIPYARNPRKNDTAVAASFKEFGFRLPMLESTGKPFPQDQSA